MRGVNQVINQNPIKPADTSKKCLKCQQIFPAAHESEHCPKCGAWLYVVNGYYCPKGQGAAK